MKSDRSLKCKVCGIKTKSIYNINFKTVPICNDCGNKIFLQQAHWLVENNKSKGG